MRTSLLVAFAFFSFSVFSQDSIKKPKIGLVLSGGGAKGLAHIGVLKEIEKAGIKIDYIGGTSMGAIIGGLYACGYTANELDSIFSELDSDAIVQDLIPRENKNFFEKNNDEVYVLTLPFQGFKITVPKAYSKGLYNYNLFSKLTHNFRHIRDFNQLKIPFLCVGTDIETGEGVVFQGGSLPKAMAASGAFPSLFSPVEIEGKYYIDGGVVNNFPVEEVKKMGADIIIGVDVQDNLKTVDEISGATGVLVQISNFKTLENFDFKRKLTDIYIKPNIEGFSVISFEEGKKIIQNGVEAAQKESEKLMSLGSGYFNNQINMPSDSIFIGGIDIQGAKNYTRSYFLGKLRLKSWDKISYNDLHSGINNLNATQNFTSIKYELGSDGFSDVLLLQVEENPIKTYLKLGVHYDDLFKSSGLVNVTKKNLFFKNDVGSFDLILGDNTRYNLEYYIDNGFHWSFGVKSNFDRFRKESKNDFKNGEYLQIIGRKSLDLDYLNLVNRAYIQTIFVQKYLIGVGIEHKFSRITSNATQNFLRYIDNSHYFSAVGFLQFDSFDNKFFPKNGWYFYGDFNGYFYSSDYNKDFNNLSTFKADAAYVKTFGKKITLKLQTEGGFSIGEKLNSINNFVLGGYGFHRFGNFKSFLGYDFLEMNGNSYVKAGLQTNWEFYRKNHINFTANFANIGNKIFDDNNWLKTADYTGYGLGYGLETLIGPIEIKHSWSPDTKKHYTWFTVGFLF